MWLTGGFLLMAVGEIATCLAKPVCPMNGAFFPRPTTLHNHPRLLSAAKEVDTLFEELVDSNPSQKNFSYGFEAFETYDGLFWSRYFTHPSLKTANTTGVRNIDSNTVVRLGSVTKLFDVWVFLITVGGGVFNDPITKYIPELRTVAENSRGGSPIWTPDWDDITVESLLTFQSGLSRDCKHGFYILRMFSTTLTRP